MSSRGSKIPTPWERPDYEQLSFEDAIAALVALVALMPTSTRFA